MNIDLGVEVACQVILSEISNRWAPLGINVRAMRAMVTSLINVTDVSPSECQFLRTEKVLIREIAGFYRFSFRATNKVYQQSGNGKSHADAADGLPSGPCPSDPGQHGTEGATNKEDTYEKSV